MAGEALFFDCFVQDIGRELHDFGSDVLKVMLTNSGDLNTHLDYAVKTDITEISEGNGYTAGGGTLASVAFSQTGGVATLTADNYVFTAVGGDIGPFQSAVLYNDTSPTKPLIWYTFNGPMTITAGNTGTVTFTDGKLIIIT